MHPPRLKGFRIHGAIAIYVSISELGSRFYKELIFKNQEELIYSHSAQNTRWVSIFPIHLSLTSRQRQLYEEGGELMYQQEKKEFYGDI